MLARQLCFFLLGGFDLRRLRLQTGNLVFELLELGWVIRLGSRTGQAWTEGLQFLVDDVEAFLRFFIH